MAEFPIDIAAFVEAVGDPPNTANQGKLYSKDDGGFTQLFYEDSAGVVYQLTPPSSGSSTFDFVLDTNAIPAGNVYADFASLYAVASLLNGTRRIFILTAFVIDAVYSLDDDWEFYGVGNLVNGNLYGGHQIENDPVLGGNFVINGGSINAKDLTFRSLGGVILRAGSNPVSSDVLAQFENTSLIADTADLWDSTAGGTLTLEFIDSQAIGNAGFVFSGVTVNLLNRNSNISSPNVFTAVSPVKLNFESGKMPDITSGGAVGAAFNVGVPPWNAGANPANYTVDVVRRIRTTTVDTSNVGVATFNNVAIWGIPWTDMLRMTVNAVGQTITGISSAVGGPAGARIAFQWVNLGPNSITIAHNSGTSIAPNRFLLSTAANYIFPVGGIVSVMYDPITTGWRVMV